MNQEQQDLQKLKVMFAKVKQKHEMDVAQNNLEEIEKNKRVMILLLDKIKEKKKQIDMATQVIDVSQNISKDQQDGKKFFAKKSHRKANKKVHVSTILILMITLLYALLCVFQYFLYQQALYLQVSENELSPNAILNLKFAGRGLGIIILTFFIIYVFNYKNMKNRKSVIVFGLVGIVGGLLSYGGIGPLTKGFFSARGFGIFPGILLLVCCYLLIKNIVVVKTKKVSSLKKSKEFKEVEVNIDEQKFEHLKKVEALKKEMAKKEKEAARRKRRKRPMNPDGTPKKKRPTNPDGTPKKKRPTNPDGTPKKKRPTNPDGTPKKKRPTNPDGTPKKKD